MDHNPRHAGWRIEWGPAQRSFMSSHEFRIRFEVAQKADAIGSTEGIIKALEASPAGTQWAVGTELNLVSRLAREMAPAKKIVSLDDCFCLCGTMFRIDPPHLLWTLEALVDGRCVNEIRVPEALAKDARTALDRMLSIT